MRSKLIVAITVLLTLLVVPAQAEEEKLHEAALKADAKAPLFTLPDGSGAEVSLKEVLTDGPALVFFYRGNWCPLCQKYMKDLADKMPEIEKLGATVIAISPQLQKYSAESAEKYNKAYHVLSDEKLEVAKQFGLDFAIDADTQKLYKGYNIDLAIFNGDDSWEMNVPGYFIINQGGVITWAYANEDYKVRPDAETLYAELAKLVK
jgi:peroxiredoxin